MKVIRLFALGLGILVATPVVAAADIVRLTNGRTLVAEQVLFEDTQVVVTLRGGGEIRMPRTMIDEILPDEIPSDRAAAIEAWDAFLEHATPARPGSEAVFAWVDVIALRMGLDRGLAHAIVRAESNYDPYAISPKGAMGLMQLMPATARQYGVRTADLFDVEQNLQTGMRHFLMLLQRYGGDTRLALAAYNAGEGAVQRYGGIPPYRETQNYVRKIMGYWYGS